MYELVRVINESCVFGLKGFTGQVEASIISPMWLQTQVTG